MPGTPVELRRELLRRLVLIEREVRSLAIADMDSPFLESIEALKGMEEELRRRLNGADETDDWNEQRSGILALWKEHRRAFERLAAEGRQRFSARPGRRDLGPRW